jgi:hypothetical protein
MDQRIIGPSDNYGGVYRATITNDLRSIPVMSIVTTMSNLFDPTIGIYSNPRGIGDNWERPCSLEYFNDLRDTNGVQVNCGLRIHGEINRRPTNPKHSLRVLFKSIYGDGRFDYELFEDDPVASYNTLVLRCMFGDSWMASDRASFLREQFAHDTQRALGHPAVRAKLVHLYLNGLYWGLFNVVERSDDAFCADHIGGPREDWDILAGNIAIEVELKEGSMAAYDAMMALVPKTPTTPINDATYAQLEQYLDMKLYAEYMIFQLWAQNFDWPRKNWRLACRRNPADPGGPPAVKFRFWFWDNESTLPWYTQDRTSIGENMADRVGPVQIYTRVRGHRKFQRLFGDRVQALFFNGGAMTSLSNLYRWVEQMELIKGAVVAESARWGDARNPSNPPYTRDVDWYDEMAIETNLWFPLRNGYVLDDFRNADLIPDIDAPVFNQHGGAVTGGFELVISASQGTVYYTTDGSDPANADDSIGDTATAYGTPVALHDNVRIKARAKDGSTWSSLTEAIFKVRRPSLRVTELMYHPSPPPITSPYGAEEFEFIELMNTGTGAVDVSRLTLSAGVDFDVSNRHDMLAAGQCLVIARNLAAFGTRYPTGSYPLVGGYDSQLANGGETLAVDDPLYGEIQRFTYDDQWYPSTDGGGYSLELLDPFGPLDRWNMQAGWRPSALIFGSPGQAIPEPAAGVATLLCGLAWCLRRRRRRTSRLFGTDPAEVVY